ncbi:hypothetical protein LINPERHAP1_LOCUS24667, partial [Linum perenne]
ITGLTSNSSAIFFCPTKTNSGDGDDGAFDGARRVYMAHDRHILSKLWKSN